MQQGHIGWGSHWVSVCVCRLYDLFSTDCTLNSQLTCPENCISQHQMYTVTLNVAIVISKHLSACIDTKWVINHCFRCHRPEIKQLPLKECFHQIRSNCPHFCPTLASLCKNPSIICAISIKAHREKYTAPIFHRTLSFIIILTMSCENFPSQC